eukprot:RCo040757
MQWIFVISSLWWKFYEIRYAAHFGMKDDSGATIDTVTAAHGDELRHLQPTAIASLSAPLELNVYCSIKDCIFCGGKEEYLPQIISKNENGLFASNNLELRAEE